MFGVGFLGTRSITTHLPRPEDPKTQVSKVQRSSDPKNQRFGPSRHARAKGVDCRNFGFWVLWDPPRGASDRRAPYLGPAGSIIMCWAPHLVQAAVIVMTGCHTQGRLGPIVICHWELRSFSPRVIDMSWAPYLGQAGPMVTSWAPYFGQAGRNSDVTLGA